MRPLRAIVTAGGTREPIDDVRVVANTSTGRFGVAIARALAWRGVEVTLVEAEQIDASGLPRQVRRLRYRSTSDLVTVLDGVLDGGLAPPPDALLMAAAVSDYSPVPTAGKLRSDADRLVIELDRTPKILPTLRDRCPDALLVGFKLMSGVSPTDLVATARRQLEDARLDLTVANDLAELGGGLHPVWLVDGHGEQRVQGERDEVAGAIADAVLARLGAPAAPEGPWASVPGPARGRARTWWRIADGLAPGAAFPDVGAALAARRSVPDEPVVVPLEAGGIAVGHAALDAVRAAEAWRAAPSLSSSDVSLWCDGVPVARAAKDGDVLHLQPTGLGDDELWPQIALPPLDPAFVTVPSDCVDDFRLAGFRPVDEGRRVTLVPPWRRADVLPAASCCLLDVATRRVLVGRRLVVASHGRVAFPGGKAEVGETPEETARRELIEEVGLRAPAGPAWLVRRVWRGDAPGFVIDCHVWRVAGTPSATASDELEPWWQSLDELIDDAEALPGVRLVLAEVRERLDRT